MRRPQGSGPRGGTGSDGSPSRRHPAAAWTACFSLLLSGCTGDGNGPPTGSSTNISTGGSTPLEVVKKLDLQLEIPWAGVFLPDGTAIISERGSARLKTVRDGKPATIGQVPGVVPAGEGGLLGLALSPDFASDKYLYLYFTAAQDNRIARVKLQEKAEGSLSFGDPDVIFTGIPKASTHNGGRIRFGPDGFLYVGTGDSQRREQPQDPNALGGKILRLTHEGKPAPGNPFGNAVYSLGHRNVQGLAWDSAGRFWASEFGPDVNDELNLIVPGGNYGWPAVTGAPHREEFRDAKAVWPSTADSSPSGLEIAGSTAYLGALRGQRLWTVPLDSEDAGAPVAYFTRQYGRIRDVVRTPDGGFWLLTNDQNPDFVVVLAPPG
ncbi:PQQ-dependent sugar dehydrogenase [Arthrobacter sp. ISL-48]|uniref:PQQ-dependent sugar dehydrogenase n=1 Tax=Arthrobacter sp. ISL-48 TaxID=2819110 RepID=UPI001BE4EA66|nr:PQQ-dependent sugar dehydrogenase [Arthrobacter sp. ISL-48]MBT2531701.1 PQQ-dependent sugar dehydrogenase [Arthrobacter sp. ISL-48]